MRQYVWVFVGLAALCLVESRTVQKRETIDPVPHATYDDIFRDKRAVDAKFGVKNAILGFVFNPPKGFAWEQTTTTKKTPTTTEDIVIFEKDKPVSLELDDKLFGSSFTLVTNLSTTVGDYMINSALRAQRLLESMRPFLRFLFGAKGIVIEATTDKPIFSDPNST
ncbi:uncharacterized protein LOC109608911 isoform X1 [Aethina tumida]|uniref:uncharacterized protein LOC109608911 isoform X1 n=1 Tax=Aethina tumida TaxID=116153 RepID=UPI00096B0B22|nr:uncharacterized protein LOC109608911 isoform X1 [Aethina tumida]XP_049825661.1 uncharacterized protein LOC109608911 isoform X1 [Aethina tumida]XP_049825662.1 uncharacterized protein LOC109608911 isoform X1 [Aethina tumida]